jgi:hypothetical protein
MLIFLRKYYRWILLPFILLLAFGLRANAVDELPTDFDEPIYMDAAQDYAAFLKAGDWNALIEYRANSEHPPLTKILYGLAHMAASGRDFGYVDKESGRWVSAVFGTLAAGALAVLNPLAGTLLAADVMAVKYTSQAYLEALPMFTSILAVLLLVQARSWRSAWFWLSAVMLGITAAGKFAYSPAALPVAYLLFAGRKQFRWAVLIYPLAAALFFFAFNPALWHDPFGRMAETFTFHLDYSHGSDVTGAALPWHQPFVWLSYPHPADWHPGVFNYPRPDTFIFVLGLLGLPWEWRERRWNFIWVLGTLLFLLAWPTKWPQYTLAVIPALCLSASCAARHLWAAWRGK